MNVLRCSSDCEVIFRKKKKKSTKYLDPKKSGPEQGTSQHDFSHFLFQFFQTSRKKKLFWKLTSFQAKFLVISRQNMKIFSKPIMMGGLFKSLASCHNRRILAKVSCMNPRSILALCVLVRTDALFRHKDERVPAFRHRWERKKKKDKREDKIETWVRVNQYFWRDKSEDDVMETKRWRLNSSTASINIYREKSPEETHLTPWMTKKSLHSVLPASKVETGVDWLQSRLIMPKNRTWYLIHSVAKRVESGASGNVESRRRRHRVRRQNWCITQCIRRYNWAALALLCSPTRRPSPGSRKTGVRQQQQQVWRWKSWRIRCTSVCVAHYTVNAVGDVHYSLFRKTGRRRRRDGLPSARHRWLSASKRRIRQRTQALTVVVVVVFFRS